MSSGREFQSVNVLLKDLSSPQFVFDRSYNNCVVGGAKYHCK